MLTAHVVHPPAQLDFDPVISDSTDTLSKVKRNQSSSLESNIINIRKINSAKHATATNYISKQEITERVEKNSEIIIIFKDRVYDLTKWIRFHPGGHLALFHLRGQDATDVMTAFHPEWVHTEKIKNFLVGSLPPHEQNRQSPISTSYQELNEQLKRDGLYKLDKEFYVGQTAKALALWLGGVVLVVFGPKHWLAYLVSAFLLGQLWQQGAFVVHDAGHSSLTHDSATDTTWGIMISSFLGGLSLIWWKNNHNIHHIMTNSEEHDPDIQHLPFLAVSKKFLNNLTSSYYNRVMEFDSVARIMIPVQHYLYYIILCFGRFNLHALGIQYLIMNPKVPFRNLEITGLLFYTVWFSWMLSHLPSWSWILSYVLFSYALTMVLHLQITLSHFGMPCGPTEGEEYAKTALRTSMDVDCPKWLDWFHGGLQFQVEHHLFPRIPRPNLRKVQPYVEKFAKQNGLKHHNYTFTNGNRIVLSALREIANHVSLLGKVAAKEVDELKFRK